MIIVDFVLPDKFLDSYYKAYVLSQYDDCDI